MDGNYVKVIGLKYDVLEGLQVVADFNRKDFAEASTKMDDNNDGNIIFLGIPCSFNSP